MEDNQKDKYIKAIENINGLTNEQKKKIIEKYKESDKIAHILFIGKTGVGISSTINSLFGVEEAKVGDLVISCTQEITEYNFCKNLIIYDSPGIGEPSKDIINKKKILDYLNKKDDNGNLLIDKAIFIFDANDLAYEESINFINQDLIPILGDAKRLLIALNKIDQFQSGYLFDKENNKPTKELDEIMKQKVKEIKKHLIKDCDIIYYCAGFEFKGKKIINPYNINIFHENIIKDMELGKRVAVYNWAKTVEKASEFLAIGGLAIGSVALGGGCLIAGWKAILLAKAFLSTLTLETLITTSYYSNILYFITSLINDYGEDYRKNQEFWNNIYNNKENIAEFIAYAEYKFESLSGLKKGKKN